MARTDMVLDALLRTEGGTLLSMPAKLDQQTGDLLMEVLGHFYTRLDLSQAEAEALSRVLASYHHADGWPEDQHRNNVFKAANLLGIKLPSSMF